MKNNVKKDNRSRVMAIVAVLIVIAMVLSVIVPIFATPVQAMTNTQTVVAVEENPYAPAPPVQSNVSISDDDTEILSETLEIVFDFGYDGGIYKENRQNPARVSIINNGEKDFKGRIEVKVPPHNIFNGESYYYSAYSHEVDIPAGGSAEYNFTVHVRNSTDYANAKVFDEKGNVLISKNRILKTISSHTPFTAVVSDSKTANLVYLKKLGFMNDNHNYFVSGNDAVVKVDSKAFPKNLEEMRAFEVMVFDDFHTASLSESQLKSLKTWVNDGGLLVVGTGLNAEKTLSGMENIFDFEFDGYSKAYFLGGSADIANIAIPNAETLDMQNGRAITKSLKVGDGAVIVHAFDLGVSPISDMENNAVYLSEQYNSVGAKGVKNFDKYRVTSVNLINNIPSPEKGNVFTLFGILVIYVIVVAPICYIVLKKRDKREYGWIAIPIIAVAFYIVMFGATVTSKYNSTYMTFDSFTDLDKPDGSTEVAIGVRSKDKGDVDIYIEGADTFYTDERGMHMDNVNKKMTDSEQTDKGTVLKQNNQQVWSDITLNTFIENKNKNLFDADFTIKDSQIFGEIKNISDKELFDIIVTFKGQSWKLGNISPEETLDVNIPLAENEDSMAWRMDSYREMTEMFFGPDFGYGNFSRAFKNGMTPLEAFSAEQRFSLFQNVNDYSSSGTPDFDIKVSAYTVENILDGEKYVNDNKIIETWNNLYQKTFKIDVSELGEYEIPFGYITPVNGINDYGESFGFDGMYTFYTGMSNNISMDFETGELPNINSFEIVWEGYDCFKNPAKIFNYRTSQWDILETMDFENNSADYISSDGTISVMADIYNDVEMPLPEISIKGGR